MLTAYDQSGELTVLPERLSPGQLRKLKSQTFYCPCCKEELIMKAGPVKVPHFSHKKSSACSASAEPESEYHLSGKRKLYVWLKKASSCESVQLEAWLPEIGQRADILLTSAGAVYAIEFQCSVISSKELIRRTNGYRRMNIIPVWILAEKTLKRISSEFQLTSFHWLFLTDQFNYPFIPLFCPVKNRFGFLHNLTPFSPRSVFASFHSVSHEDLEPGLIPVPEKYRYFEGWKQKRARWRLNQLKPARRDLFFQMLYQMGSAPALLPAEAGLPHRGLFEISTPAVKWQAALYLSVLHSRSPGEQVSYSQFLTGFRRLLNKGFILLRELPLVSARNPEAAISEYIGLLVKIGCLKEAGQGKYMLQEKLPLPQTVIEAENLEKSIHLRLME